MLDSGDTASEEAARNSYIHWFNAQEIWHFQESDIVAKVTSWPATAESWSDNG
jgi:1,2-phenylacetyl-CoA epoxidase PaaB subunit